MKEWRENAFAAHFPLPPRLKWQKKEKRIVYSRIPLIRLPRYSFFAEKEGGVLEIEILLSKLFFSIQMVGCHLFSDILLFTIRCCLSIQLCIPKLQGLGFLPMLCIFFFISHPHLHLLFVVVVKRNLDLMLGRRFVLSTEINMRSYVRFYIKRYFLGFAKSKLLPSFSPGMKWFSLKPPTFWAFLAVITFSCPMSFLYH